MSQLKDFYRQPVIYIKLPLNGKFYNDIIDLPSSGEIPVYALTAKDDIALRTPDALLSGQSTIDIIKSCIPDIKNPEDLPGIDVEYFFIAIRIASYGEHMDFETNCPECENENTFSMELTHLLDKLVNPGNVDNVIEYNNLKLHIEPISFKKLNQLQLKAFEEQRKAKSLENIDPDSITDMSEIQKMYSEITKNLSNLNVSMVTDSVTKVILPDGTEVTDTNEIKEFIEHADVRLFKQITAVSKKVADAANLEPIKVTCQNEECKHEYETPLSFDYSSFFA